MFTNSTFTCKQVCIDELIEAMESYDNNLDEWKDYLYFDPNRYAGASLAYGHCWTLLPETVLYLELAI